LQEYQITLFNQNANNKFDPVIDDLKDLNVNNMTPLQAMQILNDLQNKIKHLS